MAKPNKNKKRTTNFILLVLSLVCLLMIGSTIAMIEYFATVIRNDAAATASSYVKSTAADVIVALDSHKAKVSALASSVVTGEYENRDDFCVQLRRKPVISDSYGDIKFIRFFKDGVEYDSEGNEFDMSIENDNVKKVINDRILSCVGVIEDRHFSLSLIAFCTPLENNEYADALMVCYPVESVLKPYLEWDRADYERSLFHAVCSTRGEIVQLLHSSDRVDVQQHGDVFKIIGDEINDKSVVDSMKKNMDEGTTEVYPLTVESRQNLLIVNGIRDNDYSGFSVVGYYRAEDVNTSGYFVIHAVLGEFAIFFVIVLLLVIYSFIHSLKTKEKIAIMHDVNELLDCPTRYNFEHVSADIMARNRGTTFAIISIDISHYEYILDQIGMARMVMILKQMRLVYSKCLTIDETYAYADYGRFLLLFHYKDLADLEKRLSDIVAISQQQASTQVQNFQIVLYGGIYTTNKNLTTIPAKMIDLSIEAGKANKYEYDFGVFRVYNEMIHASSLQNDYIEVHMEQALANHDFKVFYQPKYNIAEKRIDGCEALVRWFNPEENDYMQPDVFLPLFEANRFIIKLDHYVFEQVCLYVEDAYENDLPLAPISINASRITATDKDFVEFYTKTKAAHNIDDNLLTIEFTESFAQEDYDLLRDIVNELHKNGIKCSIDDFGSGFSSYSILKELPMDEIKLDRFFIKAGYSKDRDLQVLSSIIKLGRDLRMKVTQEGVENEDQIMLLKKLGCQVIQGYYYSKPLPLMDYIKFVEQHQ